MKNILDNLAIFGAKYLLFFVIGIALFYFLKQPGDRQKRIIFFSLIVLPLSYVLAKIAGYFYYDARPFVAGNFTPLVPHDVTNGFPSDHMLLGAAVAAIIFRFNKKLGAGLFTLALLIGGARVYAGVHHVMDIIGSIAIVACVFFLASLFFKRLVSITSGKR
jgi:undecaprenyl-diphosphatase